MKEIKIFTHKHPDIDAICSVWAIKEFIKSARNATVHFRPANWDGNGMEPGDFAVDIEAGGRGIKGKKDKDGTVHSCFATIMRMHFVPKADRRALASIIKFVDAQDAHGSAVKFLAPNLSPRVTRILSETGINVVLRALQVGHGGDDLRVMEIMSVVLSGMLEMSRAKRGPARAEAARVKILCNGKVAVSIGAKERATNGIIFQRYGVRAIVYVKGHNMGVVREESETLRMDHDDILAVIREAKEEGQWFAHSKGFLLCRGSRKAPVDSSSKVDPYELARAVARLLR